MFIKKSMPVWAVLLLNVIAVTSTAVALSVNLLTTPRITINSADPAGDTDFEVQDSVIIEIIDRNTINLTVSVKNIVVSSATGAIEVQLLDGANNVIVGMNQRQSITNLAVGGTWTREFSFTTTELVDAFSTYFIILNQS